MSALRIELDTSAPLGRLTKNLAEFHKRLYREIARKIIPPLERDMDRSIRATLMKYPPARGLGSPPFVWSRDPEKNARARGWFFRNHPNGYKRTGELARSWHALAVFKDGVILFVIENTSPGATYVYGLPPSYAQVPGHEGRYPKAGAAIAPILLDVAVKAEDQIMDLTRELVTA